MQFIERIDTSFDKTNFSNYKLSIQIALNGLSFCILDKLANKYIVFKHYPIKEDLLKEDFYKKIKDILDDDNELTGEFDSVIFMHCTKRCTLVPAIFFDVKNLKKYFEFNQHMDELDELHYDMISDIDGINVFTVPNQIAIHITRKFKNAKFCHHATPFLQLNLSKNTSLIGYSVFVQLHSDFFDIAITKAKSLLLFNTFNYKTSDDLIFFISYVLNEFNLPFENTDLFIQSNGLDIDNHVNKLSEYIKNVRPLEVQSKYSISEVIRKEQFQNFMNLFNLLSCA
ncbi:MAG: DUF3822 family protein [Bacteroidales bacterium]|nr:DUF3822 family protein [Bacteroidales bacterium]